MIAVGILFVLVVAIAWSGAIERTVSRPAAIRTIGGDVTVPRAVCVPTKFRKEHW